MNYLKAKVKRLSTQSVCEMSTTMIRHLAKNGLMDDGKEDLLDCEWRENDICVAIGLMQDTQRAVQKRPASCSLNTSLAMSMHSCSSNTSRCYRFRRAIWSAQTVSS